LRFYTDEILKKDIEKRKTRIEIRKREREEKGQRKEAKYNKLKEKKLNCCILRLDTLTRNLFGQSPPES
jgi:hypothetical protein